MFGPINLSTIFVTANVILIAIPLATVQMKRKQKRPTSSTSPSASPSRSRNPFFRSTSRSTSDPPSSTIPSHPSNSNSDSTTCARTNALQHSPESPRPNPPATRRPNKSRTRSLLCINSYDGNTDDTSDSQTTISESQTRRQSRKPWDPPFPGIRSGRVSRVGTSTSHGIAVAESEGPRRGSKMGLRALPPAGPREVRRRERDVAKEEEEREEEEENGQGQGQEGVEPDRRWEWYGEGGGGYGGFEKVRSATGGLLNTVRNVLPVSIERDSDTAAAQDEPAQQMSVATQTDGEQGILPPRYEIQRPSQQDSPQPHQLSNPLPSQQANAQPPTTMTTTNPSSSSSSSKLASIIRSTSAVLLILLAIFAFAVLIAHCLAWFIVYKTEARLGELRGGLLRGGDMRVCLCAR